jgi:spore coat protein U-like protein
VSAVLASLAAGPAFGGASCSVAVTGVNFGIYDVSVTSPTDSTGAVTITCSYLPPGGATNVVFQVSLGAGTSGSLNPRQLASGPERLNYNLYRDAARTLIWGNGLAGSSVAAGNLTVGPGVGNGTRSASFPVYGRIPAQQAVNTGNYADTIVVTMEF